MKKSPGSKHVLVTGHDGAHHRIHAALVVNGIAQAVESELLQKLVQISTSPLLTQKLGTERRVEPVVAQRAASAKRAVLRCVVQLPAAVLLEVSLVHSFSVWSSLGFISQAAYS